MTVSEFIEKLKAFPADASVCVRDVDPDFKVQLFMDVLEIDRVISSEGEVVALISAEEY